MNARRVELVGGGIAAAAAGVLVPSHGVGIAAIVLAMSLALTMGRSTLVITTFALLLLIPFDFISTLGESSLGVPVVVVATLGLLPLIGLMRRIGQPPPLFLELAVLVVAISLSAAATRDLTGGARAAALWACGLGWLVAVYAVSREAPETPDMLLVVVMVAAALAGASTVLHQLTGIALWGAIPGYDPPIKTAGDWLRASAFMGHPLRLGLLSMWGVVIAFAAILTRRPRPLLWAGGGLLCSSALALSAARGSWLAAILGVGLVLALTGAFRDRRILRAVAALAVASVVIAVASGAARFVVERLVGGAVEAGSMEQRLQVVSRSFSLVRARLWFGYGFSDYAAAVVANGLKSPSLENDYIGFLVKGGLAVFGAFVLVLARSMAIAWHHRFDGTVLVYCAIGAATLVNIATFNGLDWTAMPVVVCVLLGGMAARVSALEATGPSGSGTLDSITPKR